MIPGMIGIDETGESPASALCKSCGLCCTGHLFIWAKLKPSELDPAEKMGMTVFRSDPTQRGFSHPCPLWDGHCTIHDSPHYPRVCRAYQCKLLKELLGGTTSLSTAQAMVTQAKVMIADLKVVLPASPVKTFRERLVAHIEHPPAAAETESSYVDFRLKADELLRFYETVFGVNDLLEPRP